MNSKIEDKHKVKLRLLRISGNGSLIVLNANINDIKTLLLLDTGASNSIFDKGNPIFKDIRFKSADEYGEASGFNAQITGLNTGVIKGISFGKYSKKNVKVLFTEMSHLNSLCESYDLPMVSGILGCDFLRKNKAVIDFENRLLWLK